MQPATSNPKLISKHVEINLKSQKSIEIPSFIVLISVTYSFPVLLQLVGQENTLVLDGLLMFF